jgi:SAM-dependent MidA family methyltransferase
MQSLALPTPSDEEMVHSLKLIQKIKDKLQQKTSITFDAYMDMTLYESQLGYYASSKYKFGEMGDFITAPDISTLFSQTFGKVFIEIFKGLSSQNVLEFGAGRGQFAIDCIRYLLAQKVMLEHYYIVELSASLRLEQQHYLKTELPEFFDKIIWLTELPQKGFKGIIFTNEVLDAMPVSLFKKVDGKVHEIGVILSERRFDYIDLGDQNTPLNNAVSEIEKELGCLPNQYLSEINLWVEPWVRSLYEFMEEGVVFLCDYGYTRKEYYAPSRSKGTLQCYYKHHVHDDPFVYPGLQDITAHVDFTAVAIAADDCGFDLEGYLTQSQFLTVNGIGALYEKLVDSEQDEMKNLQQTQGFKKLTSPEEMGDMFKVMAFSKGIPDDIPCFDLLNMMHKL